MAQFLYAALTLRGDFMKRVIFACAAALMLVGCASAPMASKKTGYWSEGRYRETKQADDRYEVDYVGNINTDTTAAEDLATMRAAELCQKAGYEHVRQFSRSVIVEQDLGMKAPTAEADIQCLHEPAPDTRPAADIISQARAAYPDKMEKADTKPD